MLSPSSLLLFSLQALSMHRRQRSFLYVRCSGQFLSRKAILFACREEVERLASLSAGPAEALQNFASISIPPLIVTMME